MEKKEKEGGRVNEEIRWIERKGKRRGKGRAGGGGVGKGKGGVGKRVGMEGE